MNTLVTGRRLTFWESLRLLRHLPSLVRTIFALLRDPRVALGRKALFLGALLFIISPLDVPNAIPVLGELSDLMLALLACRWFLNSCPPEVEAVPRLLRR